MSFDGMSFEFDFCIEYMDHYQYTNGMVVGSDGSLDWWDDKLVVGPSSDRNGTMCPRDTHLFYGLVDAFSR